MGIDDDNGAGTAARADDVPRTCDCHPDDNPPTPCPRRYALRDCRIADIARRIRYAADMIGDDELPTQLHALARELEGV